MTMFKEIANSNTKCWNERKITWISSKASQFEHCHFEEYHIFCQMLWDLTQWKNIIFKLCKEMQFNTWPCLRLGLARPSQISLKVSTRVENFRLISSSESGSLLSSARIDTWQGASLSLLSTNISSANTRNLSPLCHSCVHCGQNSHTNKKLRDHSSRIHNVGSSPHDCAAINFKMFRVLDHHPDEGLVLLDNEGLELLHPPFYEKNVA